MSLLYTLVIMGIPLVAALAVFGRMRTRDSSVLAAGCASIVAGIVVSFAIALLLLLIWL
jgi:hypothetical protein